MFALISLSEILFITYRILLFDFVLDARAHTHTEREGEGRETACVCERERGGLHVIEENKMERGKEKKT